MHDVSYRRVYSHVLSFSSLLTSFFCVCCLAEKVQESVDALDRSRDLNPWKKEDQFKQRLHDLLYLEEASVHRI